MNLSLNNVTASVTLKTVNYYYIFLLVSNMVRCCIARDAFNSLFGPKYGYSLLTLKWSVNSTGGSVMRGRLVLPCATAVVKQQIGFSWLSMIQKVTAQPWTRALRFMSLPEVALLHF